LFFTLLGRNLVTQHMSLNKSSVLPTISFIS